MAEQEELEVRVVLGVELVAVGPAKAAVIPPRQMKSPMRWSRIVQDDSDEFISKGRRGEER